MRSQLSLRQHKILQILRNRNAHMTSDEIAELLNVSSKTVRTDIGVINSVLSSERIHIRSVKSKGYILCAENEDLLKKLSKDHRIFLGQSDRVFYLAMRLCTCAEPLNIYDLEDEMAVSRSTMAGDLNAFKKRFVHGVPYIDLTVHKNNLQLEADERKRRFILTKLLSDNWDYNSTGSAYYESDFIDSRAFSVINSITGGVLFRHNIHLDDYSLISLILYLSVTYHQLIDGRVLNVPVWDNELSDNILEACEDLFALLENELSFTFPKEEIRETACIIAENVFPFDSDFGVTDYPEEFADLADRYLKKIFEVFHIDFRDDSEFRQGLLAFIARMNHPMKDLTVRDTPDHVKHHLFVEFDIALLFEQVAPDSFHLTEDDLLYLAWAVSGAMFHHYLIHPEDRFETVVLCHLSVHSMWSLKHALQNQFGGYLTIRKVIPVNHKDFYDFSKAKLILTTVNKSIPVPAPEEVIQISPYFSRKDSSVIGDRIRDLKIQKLYPERTKSISELLSDAFIHEKQVFSSRFDLIEYMARDFIQEGIFTETHLKAMLKHERTSSFAFDPAAALVYCLVPAGKTKLSLLTLDHRIMWNNYRIRIVFMLSLSAEDMNELFYLQETIFHRAFLPEELKILKAKEEIADFYQGH